MEKQGNFITQVIHEMKETTWPTAKEMRKYTSTVFVVVGLFGLFFWLSDSAIIWLLSFL